VGTAPRQTRAQWGKGMSSWTPGQTGHGVGLAGAAGSAAQSFTRCGTDSEEVPPSQPLACCPPPLPEVGNPRGGADSSPRVKHHVGGTPDHVRQLPHLPLHILRRVKDLSSRDKAPRAWRAAGTDPTHLPAQRPSKTPILSHP